MNKTKLFAFASGVMMLMAVTSCKNPSAPDKPKKATVPDYQVVLDIFKQINAVPRPSEHEEKIRIWLQDFAAKRNLECRENKGNIIIYKNATAGMENAPGVILQSHMDMVCVAADGYNINFLEQGIESETVGNYIQSKGNKTSLGADNGIGMAAALAILDSKEIVHGPLECLFTWNEEQGMSGAASLEPGILKGKYMINIDSEEDGQLLVGTAGSVSVHASKTYIPESAPIDYFVYELKVSGLAGGHSGVMINAGGANANKLIADYLANEPIEYRLVDFDGGEVANAITTTSEAVVMVPMDDKDAFKAHFDSVMAANKEKYKDVDLNMSCEAKQLIGTIYCLPKAAADLFVNGIANSPQGVIDWSTKVSGIFDLSNNIGIVENNPEENGEPANWYVKEMVRSFTDSKIDPLAQQIGKAFEGAQIAYTDRFAPWSPDLNDPLIVYAQSVYQMLHGAPMELLIVGGGVEASMFSVTYPDIHIICYGPTILDAHTINERVEIPTIKNIWEYTVNLLYNISNCK